MNVTHNELLPYTVNCDSLLPAAIIITFVPGFGITQHDCDKALATRSRKVSTSALEISISSKSIVRRIVGNRTISNDLRCSISLFFSSRFENDSNNEMFSYRDVNEVSVKSEMIRKDDQIKLKVVYRIHLSSSKTNENFNTLELFLALFNKHPTKHLLPN